MKTKNKKISRGDVEILYHSKVITDYTDIKDQLKNIKALKMFSRRGVRSNHEIKLQNEQFNIFDEIIDQARREYIYVSGTTLSNKVTCDLCLTGIHNNHVIQNRYNKKKFGIGQECLKSYTNTDAVKSMKADMYERTRLKKREMLYGLVPQLLMLTEYEESLKKLPLHIPVYLQEPLIKSRKRIKEIEEKILSLKSADSNTLAEGLNHQIEQFKSYVDSIEEYNRNEKHNLLAVTHSMYASVNYTSNEKEKEKIQAMLSQGFITLESIQYINDSAFRTKVIKKLTPTFKKVEVEIFPSKSINGVIIKIMRFDDLKNVEFIMHFSDFMKKYGQYVFMNKVPNVKKEIQYENLITKCSVGRKQEKILLLEKINKLLAEKDCPIVMHRCVIQNDWLIFKNTQLNDHFYKLGVDDFISNYQYLIFTDYLPKTFVSVIGKGYLDERRLTILFDQSDRKERMDIHTFDTKYYSTIK